MVIKRGGVEGRKVGRVRVEIGAEIVKGNRFECYGVFNWSFED